MTKKIKLLGASVYIGESGCAVMDDDESGSVARLISAAPDLLEALQELADLFEATMRGEYEPDSFTTQPAHNAISKALGK